MTSRTTEVHRETGKGRTLYEFPPLDPLGGEPVREVEVLSTAGPSVRIRVEGENNGS